MTTCKLYKYIKGKGCTYTSFKSEKVLNPIIIGKPRSRPKPAAPKKSNRGAPKQFAGRARSRQEQTVPLRWYEGIGRSYLQVCKKLRLAHLQIAALEARLHKLK